MQEEILKVMEALKAQAEILAGQMHKNLSTIEKNKALVSKEQRGAVGKAMKALEQMGDMQEMIKNPERFEELKKEALEQAKNLQK